LIKKKRENNPCRKTKKPGGSKKRKKSLAVKEETVSTPKEKKGMLSGKTGLQGVGGDTNLLDIRGLP